MLGDPAGMRLEELLLPGPGPRGQEMRHAPAGRCDRSAGGGSPVERRPELGAGLSRSCLSATASRRSGKPGRNSINSLFKSSP